MSRAGQEPSSELRRSVVTGVKWGTLSAGILFALSLVQTSVLARILGPRDFGLMAASLVVIGLARAFADLGLSSAIVARQMSDRHTLSSLYWASIVMGLGIGCVVAASTPLVIHFYREPRLGRILPLAALSFVIIPIGQQFQMLLQKELKIERLARVDVSAAVIGLAVSIGLAVAGAGAVSLVIGFLARLAITSALFAWWGWRESRPLFRLRWDDIHEHVGFGLYQMGERCVNFLSANVDYILIGRYVGIGALGAYSIAYQLVVKPVFELNPILTRVAFPAFAKKRDDDQALGRGYLEVIRLIAFVIVPTMCALAIVAPIFVPTVFGARWHQTIALLQIMTVVGVVRSLNSPVGDLILAKNRPDLSFKLNSLLLVTMVTALAVAVRHGVVVVALTSAVVNLADFAIFCLVLTRLITLPYCRYWTALRWPVLNSAAAAALMLLTYHSLRAAIPTDAVLLVVTLVTGAAGYCAMAIRYERSYLLRLLGLLRPARLADTTP